MKRILGISLALLLIYGGVAFAVTPDPKGTNSSPGTGDIMGQGKPFYAPHKTFRMVRYTKPNAQGSPYRASADMIAVWDSGTSGDDGITVTLSIITADSRVAGVIKVNVSPSSNDLATATYWESSQYATQDIDDINWTWLQTYGYVQIIAETRTKAPTAAAGQALGCSGIFGRATIISASEHLGSDMTIPSKMGIAGFWYDAPSAAGTAYKAFLKCE